MIDASKRESVFAWLTTIEPAERRREVAVAVAVRMALRVLPLLSDEATQVILRGPDSAIKAIILPSWRGVAFSWVAAKCPSRLGELHSHLVKTVHATAVASNKAGGLLDEAPGFSLAASAANYAVETAFSVYGVDRDIATAPVEAMPSGEAGETAAAALTASTFSGTSATAARSTFAAAFAADAAFVDSGGRGSELAAAPLWPNGVPPWAADEWRQYKSYLLALRHHWKVWTDWYDARLAGDATRPFNEALEVARVEIADEIWRQGPAVVNAEILRLIDEHKHLKLPLAADLRIGSRESLKIWMRGQHWEVAVAMASRAALRLLPLLVDGAPDRAKARLTRRFASSVCVAFQAAALARVAGRYPRRAKMFRPFAASFSRISEMYEPHMAEKGPPTALAAAAASEAAASAAFAATKSAAVSAAVDAGTAASNWADTVEEGDLLATVAAANWRAIAADAAQLKVITPSALMDAPLWPEETPGWASDAIATMRSTFRKDQNWDLWFDWLEERLRGGSRGEAYEVVFATTPELWEEDAPEVNAWIREHLPKDASLPGPLENLPSAFTYAWNSSGKIAVVAGLQNTPIFPFATSEAEHRGLLEAVRLAAQRLIADLRARKFDNIRRDFPDALKRYVGDLPIALGVGNFVLADMEALSLRALFEAEADILPSPFATRLKTLLQFHIALRAYYPEVERVYAAVGKGRLERPLPMDAVAAYTKVVAENTPRFFEPEVTNGFDAVQQAPSIVEPMPEDRRGNSVPVLPPPDPLGAPELRKSRSFTIGSAIHGLTKVALAGGSAGKAAEGWAKVAHQLQKAAGPVIDWLRAFLGS